jgi:hypothetical protein
MDIELKIEADVSLTVAISAEAQLGPIAATVEDVGTRLIVKPVASGAGNLGKYDVSFGFKPPDGIGLDKGGGHFRWWFPRFRPATLCRDDAAFFPE